jgi:hypothetical protein
MKASTTLFVAITLLATASSSAQQQDGFLIDWLQGSSSDATVRSSSAQPASQHHRDVDACLKASSMCDPFFETAYYLNVSQFSRGSTAFT